MGAIFGPVPSRRLGRSLGVDLVPFKTCSFDCIYCQLGRTTHKTVERREWVAVDDVLGAVQRTANEVKKEMLLRRLAEEFGYETLIEDATEAWQVAAEQAPRCLSLASSRATCSRWIPDMWKGISKGWIPSNRPSACWAADRLKHAAPSI